MSAYAPAQSIKEEGRLSPRIYLHIPVKPQKSAPLRIKRAFLPFYGYLTKLVLILAEVCGGVIPAFSPAFIHLISHAMFAPSVSMV